MPSPRCSRTGFEWRPWRNAEKTCADDLSGVRAGGSRLTIPRMDLQHTMRAIVRGMPRIFAGGVPVERAGERRLAHARLEVPLAPRLKLVSDAFEEGGAIPRLFTADGAGLPPPLRFSGVPAQARSLALVVEDPDAPTPNPFVHWLVYGMSPDAGTIEAALAGKALCGRNTMMRSAWAPCAPPKGDHPHRYVFQLFALSRVPALGANAGRTAVLKELALSAIALTLLTGTYQR